MGHPHHFSGGVKSAKKFVSYTKELAVGQLGFLWWSFDTGPMHSRS